MPIRILREGILTSDAVNSLTPHAELFYRRLMSVHDDFGLFDARPSILRADCYPLQIDRIREADISRWLTECETAGLILLYVVDGRAYGMVHKVEKPRAKKPKFPLPPHHLSPPANICAQTHSSESSCAQTPASAPYSYSKSYSRSRSDSGACSSSGSEGDPVPNDGADPSGPETPNPVPQAMPSPPPELPLDGDEIDRRLRAWIAAHPRLAYSPKLHGNLRQILEKGSWEDLTWAVDEAMRNAAAEPGSYALSVWRSSLDSAKLRNGRAPVQPRRARVTKVEVHQ
jgi:hypothetical protein